MKVNILSTFYYGHNEDGILSKKPVEPHVIGYVEQTVLPAMIPLSGEDYWRRFAKYFMTAVRTSYVYYQGTVLWSLELDPFAVLRFTPNSIEAAEVPVIEDPDGMEDDPQYDLVFGSWDDLMEQNFDEWKPCTEDECETIDKCILWTEDLHSEMEKILPMKRLMLGDE